MTVYTLPHPGEIRSDPTGPVTHQYVCLSATGNGAVCNSAGPRTEEPVRAQEWTHGHARDHPDHMTYAYAPHLPYVMAVRVPSSRAPSPPGP